MKMKPFNLEEALAGAPVVNGNGDAVEHLTLSEACNTANCLVGIVGGSLHTYTKDGSFGFFDVDQNIYMKVETVIINGVECPAPERVAPNVEYREPYYTPDMGSSNLYRRYIWQSDEIDERNLERGLVFLKAEDAIQVTKAILKPLQQIEKGE